MKTHEEEKENKRKQELWNYWKLGSNPGLASHTFLGTVMLFCKWHKKML